MCSFESVQIKVVLRITQAVHYKVHQKFDVLFKIMNKYYIFSVFWVIINFTLFLIVLFQYYVSKTLQKFTSILVYFPHHSTEKNIRKKHLKRHSRHFFFFFRFLIRRT